MPGGVARRLQWLNCIFTRRLRAKCHQLYELGNANKCWGGCPACSSGVARARPESHRADFFLNNHVNIGLDNICPVFVQIYIFKSDRGGGEGGTYIM